MAQRMTSEGAREAEITARAADNLIDRLRDDGALDAEGEGLAMIAAIALSNLIDHVRTTPIDGHEECVECDGTGRVVAVIHLRSGGEIHARCKAVRS